jgi:hypothetical protein
MRWTQSYCQTCNTARTAKSCGPGAPGLALSVQAILHVTVTKKVMDTGEITKQP